MIAFARVLGVVVVGAMASSCFSGEGTLGGVCERSSDCGKDQSCERAICGACGDGVAQAGEMCFDDAAVLLELPADDVPVSRPVAFDLDGNGRQDLVWAAQRGVGVAFADGEGFGEPQWVGAETTALWVGAEGGGWPVVLSRDAAGAAILWRPGVTGALSADTAMAIGALQNVRSAVLTDQLGIVGAVGESLLVVDPFEPDGLGVEVELGVEARELLGPLALDDDGVDDVFVWTAGGDLIAVHGHPAEGAPPVVGTTFRLPSAPYDIVPTAWNNDQGTDLVVLGMDRTLRVLLAAEVGSTEMTEVQSVSVAAGARELQVADLNGDTDPDILLYGPETGRTWALLRRGAELDAPVVLEEDANAGWVGAFPVGPDPFIDLLRQQDGVFDLFEGNP